MVCLWKSHNLDKRALGTYMRVTVNKGIDKCTFKIVKIKVHELFQNLMIVYTTYHT